MSERREIAFVAEQGGQTLAALVRGAMDVPWSRARTLVREGKVWLDDVREHDDARRVRAGARILVRPTAPRERLEVGAFPAERIIHVDADVVVVDKPAGISSVPFDDDEHDTVVQQVSAQLRRRERRQLPPLRVVHRLDKDTTGLLVFARTKTAERELAQQFRAHTIHRRYLGLAHGRVRAGAIESLLVTDRGDGVRGSWHGRARAPSSARRAVTHVSVERFVALPPAAFDGGVGVGVSFVHCRLETGRTHQIRIHLAEAGHALVCEPVYVRAWPPGSRDATPLLRPPPRLDAAALRVMLHAAELGFVHPDHGETVSWQAAEPEDFTAWREHLDRLARLVSDGDQGDAMVDRGPDRAAAIAPPGPAQPRPAGVSRAESQRSGPPSGSRRGRTRGR